jgi:hypothetical protein
MSRNSSHSANRSDDIKGSFSAVTSLPMSSFDSGCLRHLEAQDSRSDWHNFAYGMSCTRTGDDERLMTSEATRAAIGRFLSVSTTELHLDLCLEAVCDACVDWAAIIAEANRHLVAPALWSTLRQPQLCARLPADVRQYLSFLYLQNARRNSLIRKQCIEIGSILSKTKLSAVLLKGATWLFDAEAPPKADRMMLGIDLLVAASDIEPAVNALITAGYRKARSDNVEAGNLHEPPLLPPEGEACVKIHRDLSHRVDLLRARAVIDAASQIAPGLLLPALQHRILHNVIHSQIENGDRAGGVLNLRDTLDLARLVARCRPEFDWTALTAGTRKRGFFRVLSGAIHCAHRAFQSPLPNPFADELAGRIHAWRCIQQRQLGRLGRTLEKFGTLSRAVAWERDAYALKIPPTDRWSVKAQILVNKSRIRRAKVAFASVWLCGSATNHADDLDKVIDEIAVDKTIDEIGIDRTIDENALERTKDGMAIGGSLRGRIDIRWRAQAPGFLERVGVGHVSLSG